MDGWVYVYKNEWVDAWMGGLMYLRMSGWMYGWVG